MGQNETTAICDCGQLRKIIKGAVQKCQNCQQPPYQLWVSQKDDGTRPTKYGARKTVIDDITFDSLAEGRHYNRLKNMASVNYITNLVTHPRYLLLPSFRDSSGKLHRGISYEADFAYVERGVLIIEDIKGMETAVFKLKKKLFLSQYGLKGKRDNAPEGGEAWLLDPKQFDGDYYLAVFRVIKITINRKKGRK